MTEVLTFESIGPEATSAVGGKGLSLARMAQANLPVPPGFCITSAAFRRARGQLKLPDDLTQSITDAYRRLGGGPVAVRSSATAEDGAVTSFAGQQDTHLGVVGEAEVCDAVQRCWASLDTERARAYRRRQGVDDSEIAMAVVVQKLVPAEVAGVLFTRDPLDPRGRRLVIEASWGLGEAVVSGKVTPDRWRMDRETLAIEERSIATKPIEVTPTGTRTLPGDRQTIPCLTEPQLRELAQLGRKVEQFYGEARDVEWALAEGRFHLLQARPITTADAFEREHVRRAEIAALATAAVPGGTVWSRFNLSEILPEPTPMTWAVVRHFMSGKGGFGLMYRDLGFDPDPALDEKGIFDLVCGRPYCNLSREARMHYRRLPFEHSFAALKSEPSRALYPQPSLNFGLLRWNQMLFLPVTLAQVFWQMARAERLRQDIGKALPRQFREQVIPAFVSECQAELSREPGDYSPAELVDRFNFWNRRTLTDFARESLKPTALALLGMGNLERRLTGPLGAERAGQAVRELIMGVVPDPEADLPAGIRELASGRLSREEFLRRFGHRGNHEMELAAPRWSEVGGPQLAAAAAQSTHPPADIEAICERIGAEAKLAREPLAALRAEVATLHTWIGLRETAKHYLMLGYSILRRLLLELDRRQRLGGGIFFLTPEELTPLIRGESLTGRIDERRRRRSIVLGLEMPAVLFSDDLDAIGRSIPPEGGETLNGVPLSAGVAEAPALVLREPEIEPPSQGYVLVCPSTDPAWVPLFVHAKALVMETGGMLSHGAIVAREFGLPAVAGIPGLLQRIKTGQRLRVDGGRGTVAIVPD